MDEKWKFSRFRFRMALLLVMFLLSQNLDVSWSLNAEGLALLKFREGVVDDPYGALSNWNDDDGFNDPCLWFGVECSEGKVVALNLKDLCIGGPLAPEIGNLIHIKSIILRNNSFFGIIPEEIGKLKELEELDLGYNNFSGPLPSEFGNNLSLAILLLDNNSFLDTISPELRELNFISEHQIDENQLTHPSQGISCNRRSIPWNIVEDRDIAHRSLLGHTPAPASPHSSSPAPAPARSSSPAPASPHSSSPAPAPARSSSPAPAPARSSSPAPASPHSSSPAPAPARSSSPAPAPARSSSPAPAPAPPGPPAHSSPSPTSSSPHSSSASLPPNSDRKNRALEKHKFLVLSAIPGASIFFIASVIAIFYCRSSKVVTVKPWSTGLSGQLQKAFVTGVPKLKRSELETACEDFSNIIDSSIDGTMYKGTLSSGVEIAVTSIAATSARDWSKNFEEQFWKKIDTLSKVNHKNFVNLLGYCEEEEPFTRMMVFEYAPNGTLFEHIHVKEAERLDWGIRLRIAMGMAYCLEHMHQLTPPVIHKNLHSSIVYLTEDYAAKISNFNIWNEATASKMGPTTMELPDMPSGPESNIYSFGVILLEMVTGRLPYSVDNGPLIDWAFRGEKSLKEIVDPTLKAFQEEELKKLLEVIRSCVHPDPKQRPTMREVTAQLREITAMGPDGATPKLSPLWWAELEIASTEAS